MCSSDLRIKDSGFQSLFRVCTMHYDIPHERDTRCCLHIIYRNREGQHITAIALALEFRRQFPTGGGRINASKSRFDPLSSLDRATGSLSKQPRMGAKLSCSPGGERKETPAHCILQDQRAQLEAPERQKEKLRRLEGASSRTSSLAATKSPPPFQTVSEVLDFIATFVALGFTIFWSGG